MTSCVKYIVIEVKVIKNGSLEKYDAPLTGKHPYQSFRKPHDSHRSVAKKTAIEDYVSNSLENLKPKKVYFCFYGRANAEEQGAPIKETSQKANKNNLQ